MGRLRLALAATALLACAPAFAQDTSGCGKFKWSIARERSAFNSPDLPTISDGQSLPGIMDPAIVKLKPQNEVKFDRAPGRKPRGDNPFAAVLKLPPIAAAGSYQVTLSDEAWIDVIQNGKEVRSAGFTGQEGCPNVRKSVRFPLAVGDATVQLSGASTDSIKLDLLPTE